MNDIRILIADGDTEVRRMIKAQTAIEDFFADEATDGITALKLFRRNDYNIIILDAALQELDGWNVCRQIRKVSETPIIILSAINTEEEKLAIFDIGADDYMVKPFSAKELLARIKVILRRSGMFLNLAPRRIVFGGICIDLISRMAYVDGKSISLTPREYSLLLFMTQNPHKAFSREALLREVWGEDFFGTDRTVDTHIKTLRENIKPYQDYIATVWGYGYIFKG